MVSRREVGKLFEMLRAKRLGNGVLPAQPLAEVDQAAALRTKWTEFSSEPIAGFSAGRALDPGHGKLLGFATYGFQVGNHVNRDVQGNAGVGQGFLDIVINRLLL